MNVRIISQLNQALDPFEIDEISEEELIDVLESSQRSLVSNLAPLIALTLQKGASPSFIQVLSGILIDDSQLREDLIKRLEIPNKIKIEYFPQADTVDVSKSVYFGVNYLSYFIQNKTRSSLKNIDFEDEPVFLELVLSPKSIFHYVEQTQESDRFSKICTSSKKFVASMVCGMILCNTLASATVANDIKERSHAKVAIAHSLKKINHIAAKFEQNLNGAIEELNKAGYDVKTDRAARMAQELSTEELDNLFRNLNNSFSENPGTEKREQLGVDKIESIVDIIRAFSAERNATTEKIAKAIYQESEKHDINYKLMTALIMAESSFHTKANHKNSNGTTDISIAQINYETWSVELHRVKKITLDKKKLQTDYVYAIQMMAEVMNVYKERKKNSKEWYGYYHSGTPTVKAEYLETVDKKLQFIKKVEINNTKEKIVGLLGSLQDLDQSDPSLAKVNFDKVNKLVSTLNEVSSLIDVETKKIDKILLAKN
jgi:hypothetical protein